MIDKHVTSERKWFGHEFESDGGVLTHAPQVSEVFRSPTLNLSEKRWC
jgi:hypothetical protein